MTTRKTRITRMAGLSSIAAALALSACASTSGNTNTPAKSAAAAPPPGCVSTGSRISAPGDCAGFGRSYSQEDMKRTGGTTVGGTLSLLDPTLTVSH